MKPEISLKMTSNFSKKKKQQNNQFHNLVKLFQNDHLQ